jgi:anti-anti-sigma factor
MALAVLAPTARSIISEVRPSVAVTVRLEQMRTVVVLHGEADLSATPLLSDVFARMIATGAGDVVVDMTAVAFIDTAAFRTLAIAHRLLARRDRTLTFRGPSRAAGRLLSLFGLFGFIEPDASALRQSLGIRECAPANGRGRAGGVDRVATNDHIF